MTIWTKRILYLFCLLVFLTLAPLIIFYTQGYRYNNAKEQIESTGVIYIKSYPRAAKIFLNGIDTKNTTPNQINNLPSSFYDLLVSKEGYFSWEKNLFLPAKQTIFAEDIALFKSNPNLISQETTSLPDLIPANNNHQAVFWKKNNNQFELWLFDTQTTKSQPIAIWNKTFSTPKINWSANNQRLLLIATATSPTVIKLDTNSQLTLNQISKLTPDQIVWDDQNDNFLYFTNQQKLYRIDLLNKATSLLSVSSTKVFAPNKGSIWYLTIKDNSLLLRQHKERTNESKDWLILPNLAGWQIKTYNNIIICYNENNQTGYLLEESSDPQLRQPTISVLKEFDRFQWYGSRLLYGNKNQISLFEINSKQNQLLVRSTNPINNFFWHPNGAYYLRTRENQLIISELDNRNKTNAYEYTFAPIGNQNILFNKKGDQLFVIHQIDNNYQLSGYQMQ